jgi:hypothetical protein
MNEIGDAIRIDLATARRWANPPPPTDDAASTMSIGME